MKHNSLHLTFDESIYFTSAVFAIDLSWEQHSIYNIISLVVLHKFWIKPWARTWRLRWFNVRSSKENLKQLTRSNFFPVACFSLMCMIIIYSSYTHIHMRIYNWCYTMWICMMCVVHNMVHFMSMPISCFIIWDSYS